MKTRCMRALVIGFLCSFTWLDVSAATRVCSVYMESYAALQKQVYLGAEIFQMPQLGALPMMMPQVMPGMAQMDNAKPVALHILDVGSGEMGFVVEVTPAGTPEAYLQAIAGPEAKLPAPVKGVIELPDGTAARIAGGRVLLAMKGSDPAACLGQGAAMPAMPAVPGVIRMSLAPAALLPQLQKLRETMAAMPDQGLPTARQGQQSLEAMLDLYGAALAQMDALQIGLDIRKEGLVINTRLAPKPGSSLAAVVASLKPVRPGERAFLEKDSLFSCAMGSFTLTPQLKARVVELYSKMIAATPNFGADQVGEFTALMSQSMEAIGAPLAVSANLSTDNKALLLQGVMNVANPVSYLDKQLAMMKTPAYRKMMDRSGMRMSDPVKRTYKGIAVQTFNAKMDEAAFAEIIRGSLPSNTPPDEVDAAVQAGMGPMRALMPLFCNGYEYAATPKGVVFGMGAPAMVEEAIGQVLAPIPGASPESDRIRMLLAPSAEPYLLGRMSLCKVADLAMSMMQGKAAAPQKPAVALPAGEGLVFAHWTTRGEACSALLIPASEVNAVKARIQAAKPQGAGRRQGRGVPPPPAPADPAEMSE